MNEHAKTDPNGLYSKYFDPVESAKYLLNLSDDGAKVVVTKSEDRADGTIVSIKFVKENKFMDILMIKPWGDDGIYVPKMKMPSGSYGERNYELLNDEIGSLQGDESASEEDKSNLLYTENTDEEILNLPYSGGMEEVQDVDEPAEYEIVSGDEP